MIKLVGSLREGDGDVLILGLNQQNWDRLVAGNPIQIKLPGEMKGISWKGEILIMGAETQQDIMHELSTMGVLRDVPVHHFDESKEQM